MSWEIIQTKTHPCDCGAGTVTFTLETDDWNRTRSSTEIHCPKCREKKQHKMKAEQAREKKRDRLLQQAQQLATERYRAKWLALFSGLTKKAAWELYTGDTGYPALGTFYKHVKHLGGLSNYLEWCLTNDLERSLRVLGIVDHEIDDLLQKRAQLWRPTGRPL